MIQRLMVAIMGVSFALLLSACGDKAEKKVETQAQQELEKQDSAVSKPEGDVQSANEVEENISNAAAESVSQNAQDANINAAVAAADSAAQSAAVNESADASDRSAAMDQSA